MSEAAQSSLTGWSGTGSLVEAASAERDTRRQRSLIFGTDLPSDPCWDLLLDLFIASAKGRRMSVAAACLAAPVPEGTALRCIAHLVDVGLVVQAAEPGGPAAPYLVPTAHAVTKLTDFFACLETDAEKSAA